jgi:hypothetical protein
MLGRILENMIKVKVNQSGKQILSEEIQNSNQINIKVFQAKTVGYPSVK